MPDPDPRRSRSELRRLALSRWDNEGGAIASEALGTRENAPDLTADLTPDLTNAELVQLRIRVIALENLMIAVLAEGSDRQRAVAIEMAAYISPRPGFTHHPLTIKAADHMTDLVDRAAHFQGLPPS